MPRSLRLAAPRWSALLGLLLACQKPSPADDGAVEPSVGTPMATAEAIREAVARVELATSSTTAAAATPEPEPVWRLPADYLQFDGACTTSPRVRLAFVGDLLLHHELQIQAYAAEDGAAVLWSNIADLLAAPDLTYLNLEGPLAHGLDRDFLEVEDPGRVFDRVVYTGYPRFNYHGSIALDVANAGVDIVSTANNHALDRGSVGVTHTIEALRKAKLDWIGTREHGELERLYTITEVGGLKIAWLACTRNTNQVPDDLDQVMQCGTGKGIEEQIQRLRATGRFAQREPKVDAVIVTPHWGKEYMHEPRDIEREWAQRWIDAGALAIIGSHPHVVQPWAKLHAPDGREGFVIYSLGNFVSHQPELSRRSSLMLDLELTRAEDGQVHIVGVQYIPLHVRQDGDQFFVEAIDRVGPAGAPAEARALLVALLGAGNLALPDERGPTDPHCDDSWRPHDVPSWAQLQAPFVIPGTEPELLAEGEALDGDPAG